MIIVQRVLHHNAHLITVLALEVEDLVLVRYPDVLPERPLVTTALPAVLAEVTLAVSCLLETSTLLIQC